MGGLTFVQGGFALAASGYPFLAISPSGPYDYTLERCGSPLKLKLATYSQTGPDILISSRAALWQGAHPELGAGADNLHGRFLPSLLEFEIPWPRAYGGGALSALTNRTIYIVTVGAGGPQQLWAADIPAEPPTVSAVQISPRTFALAGRLVKRRCVKVTPANRANHTCTRPISLLVSYNLNISAGVRFAIKRPAPGHLVKHRCVTPTRSNSHHRRCTRQITLGRFLSPGKAGRNSLILHGRFGRHQLVPGTYWLTATGNRTGHSGTNESVAFRITP